MTSYYLIAALSDANRSCFIVAWSNKLGFLYARNIIITVITQVSSILCKAKMMIG